MRWLHLKGKEFSGPSGGNGGRGGGVYVRAVRDTSILSRYTGEKHFEAGKGEDGGGRSKKGKDGADVVIDLPVGSVVTNLDTKEVFELLREGEQVLVLSGGRGGIGNEYFKSSTNRTPTQSTLGEEGQSGTFTIEVRLIADAGFVGLPNAGKSSLLNALTNAQAKVGDYAFTTLDPNLGKLYEFVLADIPGLIEGASEGKGLGHKFLKHVSRTKVLFHCVSIEDEEYCKRYDTVRGELAAFDAALAAKREVVVLTKADLVSPEMVENAKAAFSVRGIEAIPLSIIDDAALKRFSDRAVAILREETSSPRPG